MLTMHQEQAGSPQRPECRGWKKHLEPGSTSLECRAKDFGLLSREQWEVLGVCKQVQT